MRTIKTLLNWCKHLLIACAHTTILYGQNFYTHPIVGAISDSALSVFWFCSPDDTFTLYLTGPGQNIQTLLTCNSDSTLKWKSPILRPNSYYDITVINKLDTISKMRIKTFPRGDTANVKLAFGSCLEKHDSIFIPITKLKPDIFIYLGDWDYPDRGFSIRDTSFFAENFDSVKQSWIRRYSKFPNQISASSKIPFDYVWDDHDYIANDASKNYTIYYTDGSTLYGNLIPIPQSARANSLKGYKAYFPHYPLPNPNSIYHSFTLGPIKVIVLDLRSTKENHLFAFSKTGGIWQYDSSQFLRIIDSAQWQWLKKEITSSTEPWLIIASSLVFSQYFTPLIDNMMSLQNIIGDSAVLIAMYIADQWAGYRHQADSLIQLLTELNRLHSTVIISGDIHTSGIDTSRKGGLYEIVAANLGQKNSRIARQLDSIFNMRPWDIAQGLDNDNFSSALGYIEAWGDDSLKMCIIDMNETIVGCHTIYNAFQTDNTQDSISSTYNQKQSEEVKCTDKTCVINANTWEIIAIGLDGKIIERHVGNGFYTFTKKQGIIYKISPNKSDKYIIVK